MPHIVVKIVPKSEDEKVAIADAIAQLIATHLAIEEKFVSVAIEDVEPSDWADAVYKPEILGKWDQVYRKPGYEIP